MFKAIVFTVVLLGLSACQMGVSKDPGPLTADERTVLLNAKHPAINQKAPEKFKVEFKTSGGDFIVDVTREWAPLGADRFYNLVKNRYYDECRFFRCLKNYNAQFGIHGDPEVSKVWSNALIKDDPLKISNARSYVIFALGGPNTRSNQISIHRTNCFHHDKQAGFSPFGKVIKGMDIVDNLYSDYGEGGPTGNGPPQHMIQKKGNAYLKKEFPKLDYIISARVID